MSLISHCPDHLTRNVGWVGWVCKENANVLADVQKEMNNCFTVQIAFPTTFPPFIFSSLTSSSIRPYLLDELSVHHPVLIISLQRSIINKKAHSTPVLLCLQTIASSLLTAW